MGQKQNVIHTQTLKEVQEEQVQWLWQGYLPLGKIVLLDGDPGLGKSTLLLDLAAKITTGGQLPDGSPAPTGNVVILSGEDGAGDTIKPRFLAAGGDASRVHVIHSITDTDGKRPIMLPNDTKEVKALLEQTNARLMIMDPLFAFLPDLQRDIQIRRALMSIRDMAQETQCCIIGLRHLNKQSGCGSAVYRGSGQIAYAGAARAVYVVGKDPQDSNKRILACSKVNLSVMPKSLRYQLAAHGNATVVQWEGACEVSADELVSRDNNGQDREELEVKKSKVEVATAILQLLLNEGGGRVRVKDAYAEGKEASISHDTLNRARLKMGLEMKNEQEEGMRVYYWTQELA